MNLAKNAVIATSLMFFSASAFAMPFIQNAALGVDNKSVSKTVASMVRDNLGRDLSAEEMRLIRARVAQTTTSEEAQLIRVSDEGTVAYQKDIYICAGIKAAVLLIAGQGLRCVSTSDGTFVNVMFNSNVGYHDNKVNSSLTADGYLGINVGVAVDLGVMVINHPVGTSTVSVDADDYYRSRRDNELSRAEGKAKGGLVNGSWMLFGAMGGYFYKGNSYVFIGAWQPGFAAEISASDIRIENAM